MTVPSRISIVTPGVADLGRATSSCEALGQRRRPEPPRQPARGELRGATCAIGCDCDDDVLAVLAAAEAAGAVVSEPAERSPFFDGLDGCFLDPDAHAREVAHDPDLHGPPR